MTWIRARFSLSEIAPMEELKPRHPNSLFLKIPFKVWKKVKKPFFLVLEGDPPCHSVSVCRSLCVCKAFFTHLLTWKVQKKPRLSHWEVYILECKLLFSAIALRFPSSSPPSSYHHHPESGQKRTFLQRSQLALLATIARCPSVPHTFLPSWARGRVRLSVCLSVCLLTSLKPIYQCCYITLSLSLFLLVFEKVGFFFFPWASKKLLAASDVIL